MTRYHTTAEGNIPFTPEEEAARDTQEAAIEAELPKLVIKGQITMLESSITDRRQREAILGIDNGWLAAKNAEIAALRAQL